MEDVNKTCNIITGNEELQRNRLLELAPNRATQGHVARV